MDGPLLVRERQEHFEFSAGDEAPAVGLRRLEPGRDPMPDFALVRPEKAEVEDEIIRRGAFAHPGLGRSRERPGQLQGKCNFHGISILHRSRFWI